MGRPPVRVFLAALATVAVACTSAPAAAPPVPSATPTSSLTPSASPSPTPSPTPSPSPSPSPTTVIGAFDAESALAFAVALAEMGTRDAGTPGDVDARAVIRSAFEASGWTVVEEVVPLPQGGTTVNIVAVRDLAHLAGPHVVVGGHHDTRGGSPGANDNASGIGVLVTLAQELADEPSGIPVVLVAFGAEEFQPSQPRQHHLGSQRYVAQRGERTLAALVVDMVANGPSTCICWFDAGPRTLADELLAVADAAGLDGYRVERRGDISDHGPFARAGVPAAFLWTFDDGVLHTPRDTPDRLVLEDLRRAGDLALAWVRSLASRQVDEAR